jgi:transcriptional regulator with XRE-family HTH domain
MDMTMGKRIKIARQRLNMTQDELAGALGVTYQSVSQWERDLGGPGPERIPGLRRVLKVTYAWLMEGADAPPAPTDDAVLAENARSELYSVRRGAA